MLETILKRCNLQRIPEPAKPKRKSTKHYVGKIKKTISYLGHESEFDQDTIKDWIPKFGVVAVDADTGKPLHKLDAASTAMSNYYVNPHTDLDLIAIHAICRDTIVGGLMNSLTRFLCGRGFRPELELISPSEDSEKNEKKIKAHKKVIDELLKIDNQISHYNAISFFEFITILIDGTNTFGRSCLLIDDFKNPKHIKFCHARDMGITEISQMGILKSVQIRGFTDQIKAENLIYLWNPLVSSKYHLSWMYGASLVMPMLDAARVLHQVIGVDFKALAESAWAGSYLLTVRPQGGDDASKNDEYTQIASGLSRGGASILLENPEDTKSEQIDFKGEFDGLVKMNDHLIKYAVATLGLPQSLFFDESSTNRSTMLAKIQLTLETNIEPMRATLSRQIADQWYMRHFERLYPKLKDEFRIVIRFDDLAIAEWYDLVTSTLALDSRAKLKDDRFGKLLGLSNYQHMIADDATVTPGGVEVKKGQDLSKKGDL